MNFRYKFFTLFFLYFVGALSPIGLSAGVVSQADLRSLSLACGSLLGKAGASGLNLTPQDSRQRIPEHHELLGLETFLNLLRIADVASQTIPEVSSDTEQLKIYSQLTVEVQDGTFDQNFSELEIMAVILKLRMGGHTDRQLKNSDRYLLEAIESRMQYLVAEGFARPRSAVERFISQILVYRAREDPNYLVKQKKLNALAIRLDFLAASEESSRLLKEAIDSLANPVVEPVEYSLIELALMNPNTTNKTLAMIDQLLSSASDRALKERIRLRLEALVEGLFETDMVGVSLEDRALVSARHLVKEVYERNLLGAENSGRTIRVGSEALALLRASRFSIEKLDQDISTLLDMPDVSDDSMNLSDVYLQVERLILERAIVEGLLDPIYSAEVRRRLLSAYESRVKSQGRLSKTQSAVLLGIKELAEDALDYQAGDQGQYVPMFLRAHRLSREQQEYAWGELEAIDYFLVENGIYFDFDDKILESLSNFQFGGVGIFKDIASQNRFTHGLQQQTEMVVFSAELIELFLEGYVAALPHLSESEKLRLRERLLNIVDETVKSFNRNGEPEPNEVIGARHHVIPQLENGRERMAARHNASLLRLVVDPLPLGSQTVEFSLKEFSRLSLNDPEFMRQLDFIRRALANPETHEEAIRLLRQGVEDGSLVSDKAHWNSLDQTLRTLAPMLVAKSTQGALAIDLSTLEIVLELSDPDRVRLKEAVKATVVLLNRHKVQNP